MTSLRCLWITRVAPYPPFVGGDFSYSARLIESLGAAGVELTVLTHDSGGTVPPPTAGVEWVLVPFKDRGRIRSLLGRTPSIVHRFSSPEIRAGLAAQLRERSWDSVLIDSVAVAGAMDSMRHLRGGSRSIPLVYVSHNHEESVRRQLAANCRRRSPTCLALGLDAAKTIPIERRLVEDSDLVTVVSNHDAALFRRRAPSKRYLVLTPGYDEAPVTARTIDKTRPRRVVLLGSYAWIAKQLNLWRFLQEGAGPLGRAGIGIDIVGMMPADFEHRIRATFPGVTLTGQVDRVEPYLAQARLGVVAEQIGGGFKLKVLDYVFNRLPVASLAGSVAGTPLAAGDSIVEFPDVAQLVKGIIGMIDDVPLLNAVQEAAYRACQGRFVSADRGIALAAAITELRTLTGRTDA